MTKRALQQLRYPIGDMPAPLSFSESDITNWVNDIEKLPAKLRTAVQNLTIEQLDTPYRPEGWTVRQVVHHVSDSHLNAFARLKLALTEENPTIKPYEEQFWAELTDSKMPIEPSLRIIENMHLKMVNILRELSATELDRTFFHPGSKKTFKVGTLAAMYAWHGLHHLAHIENLAKREKW
ncbi:MAG: putative metal-dependent hydrolase [Saprospiraceae bacterium]|nr:putative metal-dependent hydrolase [Saprospiraceae bacterium]